MCSNHYIFYVNLVFIIFTILFVFSVKNKPEIIKIRIRKNNNAIAGNKYSKEEDTIALLTKNVKIPQLVIPIIKRPILSHLFKDAFMLISVVFLFSVIITSILGLSTLFEKGWCCIMEKPSSLILPTNNDRPILDRSILSSLNIFLFY